MGGANARSSKSSLIPIPVINLVSSIAWMSVFYDSGANNDNSIPFDSFRRVLLNYAEAKRSLESSRMRIGKNDRCYGVVAGDNRRF